MSKTTKITGKELRKMPKSQKKIITFYLTTEEALELQFKVQTSNKTSQDFLRDLVLKNIKG